MKNKKDWKLILGTNNYNSIFIFNENDKKSLSLFLNYIEEVEKISEFHFLLPTIQELESKDNSGFLIKFSSKLKSFFENNDKKTLIVEESVLNTLLKPEKRESFFKLLIKQKKNIVLFCDENYDEYIKDLKGTQNYNYMIVKYTDWEKRISIFDRFSDIKKAVEKTYNPFKEPIESFKKYVEY